MKKPIVSLLTLFLALTLNAQTALKKVYNEDINPIEQIDQALVKARSEGKFVINVSGYIGESTRSEIAYAERTGKKVNYLEPIV